MEIDDKIVADLKAKHAGVPMTAVPCADGSFLIFRRPARIEFDRWFDQQSADKPKTAAARELAQATLLYPDRTAMIAALDAEPFLLMRPGGILDAITELAGVGGKADEPKKL